ncbi:tetratricopeptide repeat protein [Frigoriflavimonas asaccharolytica]|uniref:Tetratricopeptide (TPR) repeat protein n=1 Tax=Frigoriflavimonas asaccharolytica TaxID=2735899 RepID=A0A8J8G8Y1_9FLAO|nr:tetratricopeptide repeat protein [Frigoriflavimonas asaccharolytica]NRS92870.1 tetratricopeptide (TPR) repeat protein [Frigoriflavimonas asaccharolytica]
MNCKSIFSLFMMLFCAGSFFAQKSYDALIYEGNKDFDNKKYDAATSKYADAVQKNSKDFTAHYNLGNSLYKTEKYKEAQAEFEKAEKLASNSQDKSAALHNLGNAYIQQKNPEKAAEFYKQSLKNNPYSEATRKNYEIAKLEQKKQEQKNQDQQDKEKEGDSKDDKNKGDKGKEGDEKKSSQPNGEDKDENGEDPKGDKNKEDQRGKLPKDLQNAILNRSKNKEQETARKILNKNAYSMPESNEKDW